MLYRWPSSSIPYLLVYCNCERIPILVNILINHLLVQMIQSTSHPSSLHGSGSSNATQYTPNTDMDMGQFPWPQPAHIHPHYPYAVPPNGTRGATPQDAPIAPSPGVGVGVAHPAFQAGQGGCHLPAAANVPGAPYVGPYPPLTAAAPPPQHPFVPPLHHQSFPSNSFPGAMTPDAPGILYQAYLHQYHGARLAIGSASSFLPQAPSFSAGQKHGAEDLEGRNVKRIKIGSSDCAIKNDPLFTPVLNQYGQYDGTYVCSKDGMVIRPGSHRHHIRTAKHRGQKLPLFKCPRCLRTYTRRDACKRHWDNGCGKFMVTADGAPLSYSAVCQGSMSTPSASPVEVPTAAYSAACQGSTSTASASPVEVPTAAYSAACQGSTSTASASPVEVPTATYSAACQGSMSTASASPVQVPTAAYTFTLPIFASTFDPLAPEITPTEATEDAPGPDCSAANETQDSALVAPVLPPPKVREITLAEVRGSLDFWKWINSTEDNVDSVLPISEPSSSRLPETILAEAAENPDVWMLINEVEDFVDPEVPLCESPADAAEDPEFCNFPIRTLLICSWLDNSYGALHQRSPSELVPLSSTLIDHEM